MRVDDLDTVGRAAFHRAFDKLSEGGADPVLEDVDGDLTLFTESASASLCMVVERRSVALGEVSVTLLAIPGEGERWVAEVLADEVVGVVRGLVDDE